MSYRSRKLRDEIEDRLGLSLETKKKWFRTLVDACQDEMHHGGGGGGDGGDGGSSDALEGATKSVIPTLPREMWESIYMHSLETYEVPRFTPGSLGNQMGIYTTRSKIGLTVVGSCNKQRDMVH